MKCESCKRYKPLEEFPWKNKAANKKHKRCRRCHSKYQKLHYKRNRAKRLEQVQAWKKERKTENRQKVRDYLENHPCIDCGEGDLIVLDFDHLSDKECNISDLLQNHVPWDKIAAEIEKCVVRCANCHRRKTASDQMSWRLA